MFYITASSPSLFVCFACCTGDDLQSVCTGAHSHSYSQNSKGKKEHRRIMKVLQHAIHVTQIKDRFIIYPLSFLHIFAIFMYL